MSRITTKDAFPGQEKARCRPRKVDNNTWRHTPYPGIEAIRHFRTDIVVKDYNRGVVRITTGGHHSATTKERINHYGPGITIRQRNYRWYFNLHITDGVSVEMDYEDGMEIPISETDRITAAKRGDYGKAVQLQVLYSGKTTPDSDENAQQEGK